MSVPRLRAHRAAVLAAVALLVLPTPACDSPTSANDAAEETVALPGGSTLVFEGAAAIAAFRPRIEQVVRETLDAARSVIPVERITIIVGTGTANAIPEIGFGGRADGGTVFLGFDPDFAALATTIDADLFPLLAHELHHVARIRAVGYGDNLLGAMVSEGLADHFSIELAGVDPPIWATALSPQQLVTWSSNAQQQWFDGNFDHAGWFFGNGTIPRWTGYTVGFELTGAYLAAHPGRRASDLIAEPATSFIPPVPPGQRPVGRDD